MKEFLERVLPSTGHVCIVGIKNGKVRQQFAETIDEAVEHATRAAATGHDTYFACARFKTSDNRKQENVNALKSFYVDIDCGTGKPYPDKPTGLAALKSACEKLLLPLPTVVDSGRGIHGYWILPESIESARWQIIADRLKSAFLKHIEIDPVVTADSARIMRMPGTLNTKSGTEATLLKWGKEVPILFFEGLDELTLVLKASTNSSTTHASSLISQAPKRPLDPITAALLGNIESNFAKIMRRAEFGTGCAQLEYAFTNQSTLSEPIWRGALSVAQCCTDRDTAIHLLSDQHPQYDYAATEKKAMGTKGPYTCATFDGTHAGLCRTCSHWGVITSPIQLGKIIKEYVSPQPTLIPALQTTTPYLVPTEYPEGYFRGENGGIYRESFKEEEEDELIYKYDLYCQNRVTDPEKGDVIQLVLKLPHDAVKTFLIPTSDLQSRDKARGVLASYGVAVVPQKMEKIVAYVINWVDFLERAKKSDKSHTQMGWTNSDTFVLGEREITPVEHKYSPPSAHTMRIVSAIGQKGTLENWERVANMYAKPGMEIQAFALMLGFGVPLFKFTNLKGAVLNMISKDSGTGKSTVLAAINSIYGNPDKLMGIWSDTANHLVHNLGVMNNLPACTDEVTTWEGKRVSEYAFAVSQGRGKHRMQQSVNMERVNETSWQLVSICSSNTSMYDKMAETKVSFEGEKYRIFETIVPSTTVIGKEEADRTFHLFSENYGHAGALFIDFVVKNREAVIEKLMEVRRTFDAAVNMQGKERYWSAMIACGLTAGIIAQRDLGLLQEVDFMRVYEYMVATMQQVRVTTASAAAVPSDILGNYLNKLIANNALIIDSVEDVRYKVNKAIAPAPYREPRGELVIRYERNMQRVFVPRAHFRAYCSKVSTPFSEILKYLSDRRILIDTVKKRLGKGSMFNTPPVDCFVLDSSHPEFMMDVDDEKIAAEEDAASAIG